MIGSFFKSLADILCEEEPLDPVLALEDEEEDEDEEFLGDDEDELEDEDEDFLDDEDAPLEDDEDDDEF